jgi:hypothetical protein
MQKEKKEKQSWTICLSVCLLGWASSGGQRHQEVSCSVLGEKRGIAIRKRGVQAETETRFRSLKRERERERE